jgi:hypothetical protein
MEDELKPWPRWVGSRPSTGMLETLVELVVKDPVQPTLDVYQELVRRGYDTANIQTVRALISRVVTVLEVLQRLGLLKQPLVPARGKRNYAEFPYI